MHRKKFQRDGKLDLFVIDKKDVKCESLTSFLVNRSLQMLNTSQVPTTKSSSPRELMT